MKKVAVVRGKFLNKYELQFFEPLAAKYKMLGIGSKSCFHEKFRFPVVKLYSPVDIPDFPYKMPILNRLFIDANYLFGLNKVIAGYDIVHSAETYYHYTIQCLNAKKQNLVKKVVVSVYENIPFAGEGIWGRKTFKQRVLNEADHLIAVSHKTKKALLIEGFDDKKISIITQHVDTSVFKPRKTKKEKNTLTILFTGRLEYYKGVFDFVNAAAIVIKNKKLKNFKLNFVMIGKGSQKDNLLNLEKELGIEKFINHKDLSYDKIPIEYNKADIYIAPSRSTRHWQEQFSTVLLEAKSSGLPVISTNTGGIPENVGHAGILVKEGDVEAIARHTARLIVNTKERDKWSKIARLDALSRFAIKIGADKLDKVYQKVLA